MPTLYLANCTDFQRSIRYRPDFNNPAAGARMQEIPPGRQALVYQRNAPLPAVEEIVKQLSRYGMLGTVELNRMPNRVVPMIFSIDKTISADQIRRVREHNRGVKTVEGTDIRKRAAIGAKSFVDTAAMNTNVAQGEFEIGLRTTKTFEDNQETVDEAISVSDDAPSPASPRRRRGPTAKAA